MTKRQILEARNKLVTEYRDVVEAAEKAERGLTPEEREKLDKIRADIESLEAREKAREEADRLLADSEGRKAFGDPADRTPEDRAAKGDVATRNWGTFVNGGVDALPKEARQAVSARAMEIFPEVRAMSTQAGASGAYFIEDQPLQNIESAMKYYGGILDACTVINTDNGADLPFPTDNDVSNKGARLAEGTQITEQDVSVGQVVYKAYTYTSKLVRVPWQLLNDSAFDVPSWLEGKFAERLGRILNEEATTGTGAGQPKGIVTASALGKTTAGATAITYAELVDLEHSVDVAYRRAPGAGWMANDGVIKYLKQLLDSSNRPIWMPALSGLAGGFPATLLGYPYFINNDMQATVATATKTVLFGNLKKYQVRRVRGIAVVRLNERYADYLQTGFFAYMRADANLLDAGGNPIKHMLQA